MRYPTVYTAPSDRPKFDFLQTSNYLSEFKSEVDKARVRENLGIPDEFTLYWGNIRGNIANQTDLISLINEVKQGLNNTYGVQLSSISTNIEALNANQVKQTSDIDKCNTAYSEIKTYLPELRTIYSTLAELRTDIAQNATAIQQLGGGDVTYASIPAKVSELTTAVSANTAKTSVNASNIAAAQTQINVNTTNITALQTQIAKIGDLTSVTGLQATVASHTTSIGELITKYGALESHLSGLDLSIGNHETDIHSLTIAQQTLSNTVDTVQSRLNTCETNIKSLQSVHNTYSSETMNTNIATNRQLITALQSSINNLPNYNSIINRVAYLESKLGEVILTSITLSNTNISTTTTGVNEYEEIVTAHYSTGATSDVTNSVSVSSDHPEVAYWNGGKVYTTATPGIATLTFTYSQNSAVQSVTLIVSVVQGEVQRTIMQYIGYADNYTNLLTTQGYTTIKGTWTQANTPDMHTASVYGFWIVTTEALTSIKEIGTYSPSDLSAGTYTDSDGNEYNVYVLVTGSSDLTITIS